MPRPPKNKVVPEPPVPVAAAAPPNVVAAVQPAALTLKQVPPVIDVGQFIRVRDSVRRIASLCNFPKDPCPRVAQRLDPQLQHLPASQPTLLSNPHLHPQPHPANRVRIKARNTRQQQQPPSRVVSHPFPQHSAWYAPVQGTMELHPLFSPAIVGNAWLHYREV